MAGILVVLICAVADIFLVYVLFQFTRELRAQRLARNVSAAIPVPTPNGEKAAGGRDRRKVIDITSRKLSVISQSELAQGFSIVGKGKDGSSSGVRAQRSPL